MLKLAKFHNWLIFLIVGRDLKKRLAQYASGVMVDIGCGEKPYQKMAAAYVQKHVGVDHSDTFHNKSRIDLVGTAYKIPYGNESCDSILCTAVLEHLEAPDLAIAEAFRILRSGGYAIYTVPLFWHLHEEPRDFYRYTKYGLEYLFEKNGFEIIEISALTGFCVTFAQELVYYIQRFRKGRWLNPLWWTIPFISTIIQVLGYLLSIIDHSEGYTALYIAVVKKP